MEARLIDIRELKPNKGQIDGVPGNPRFIRDERFEKLKESIKADPGMMQVREIVAYDNNGELVIIMGNMRYRAAKALGIKEVPVKILPRDTPPEKLRAYIIKDNVPFGETDWDMLANEWDAEELESWGMELPTEWTNPDNYDDTFALPDGEKQGMETMRLQLSAEQAEAIRNAIERAKKNGIRCETFGNANSNGNAMYQIVKEWEELKR